MPSMMVVGTLCTHRRPPEAPHGPQSGPNALVSCIPFVYGSRKRTVRADAAPRGFDLPMGGCQLLNTGAECSALPPEAVWGRTTRCRGAYGVPANLFSYGSFPLDCPRGITGCRWRRECVMRCQIAGFDELSKRVPQPPRGVELTAVGGRRGVGRFANRGVTVTMYA